MQLRAFGPDVIGPLAPFVKAHYRELLNIAPAITYERTLELFEHDRPYPALAKRRMMWADILCSFLNTGDFSESIIVSPSCRKIIDYNRKTDLYDKEALDKKERYLRSDEVSSFFHSFGTNTQLQDALSDAVATACADAAHIGQYEIADYANSLTQNDNERRKIIGELIKRTGGF